MTKRVNSKRLLNRKPDEYSMQFMGAGEKMLWVNSFCKTQKESFKGWEDKLMLAAGGNCFYNVLFNVDKPGEPYKLLVNGNA